MAEQPIPRNRQALKGRVRSTAQGQTAGIVGVLTLLPADWQAPTLALWTLVTQVAGTVARDRIAQGHQGLLWLILAQLG
jgi:hypothetical protein